MRVAVLIIHGIGAQRPDFADKFCNQLDSSVYERDITGLSVEYYPFEWQHFVEPTEEAAFKNLPKMGWRKTRDFALTYVGDVIAYQRQINDDNFYQQVHKALDDKLVEIGKWLGSDGKLVIVAHSLGTIIVSNFIWDIQHKMSVGNTLHEATITARSVLNQIEVLYTLGSPLLIWSLSHDGGGMPIHVQKWKNVYNPNDVVGYPLKPINEAYSNLAGLEDIPMKVGGIFSCWNPLSHITYFDSTKLRNMIVDDICEEKSTGIVEKKNVW